MLVKERKDLLQIVPSLKREKARSPKFLPQTLFDVGNNEKSFGVKEVNPNPPGI